MKNVTISLQDSVALAAKVKAAKKYKSLSAYIAEILHREMQEDDNYEDAMRSYLAENPYLDTKGYKFNREELYDRTVLR